MIKINDKTKCSGCHACASICPKSCITMERDEEGFLYPIVNETLCTDCGICERVCPIVEKNKTDDNPCAYAVKNANLDVRMQSSSGGVFSAFAEDIISSGGVVFGAAFDENFKVCHICVDNINDLSKLRGSKYVQSEIGDTYKQAKEYLDAEKSVFFTGTPCQIEGLLKYLGKRYDKLITADIICHGVPSPTVWKTYLETLTKKPKQIYFRNKDAGWGKPSFKIVYEDESVSVFPMTQNPYTKVFLKNICLRPSCYSCNFKTKNRISDLTLADFWGIEYIEPEINDDKGVSLLLVHTKKGEEFVNSLDSKIDKKEVNLEKALKMNTPALKSAKLTSKRKKFMNEYTKETFAEISEKYTKTTFLQKVKGKIKRLARKIFK